MRELSVDVKVSHLHRLDIKPEEIANALAVSASLGKIGQLAPLDVTFRSHTSFLTISSPTTHVETPTLLQTNNALVRLDLPKKVQEDAFGCVLRRCPHRATVFLSVWNATNELDLRDWDLSLAEEIAVLVYLWITRESRRIARRMHLTSLPFLPDTIHGAFNSMKAIEGTEAVKTTTITGSVFLATRNDDGIMTDFDMSVEDIEEVPSGKCFS